MPEIFRFTQLREPTGINVEEVRQNHIQFFKQIEEVENMSINKSFIESFEKGIQATSNYVAKNEGFLIRAKIPQATITGKWNKPLDESQKVFFELSFLLSQYYSDTKENKNEALFFYTDGIVEARNEHGQFYGEERFFDLLARNQTMPPAAICDLLGTELKMFVKEVPEGVQDDVSLLGVSMLLSDIEKDYVSALRDIPASQVLSHE